MKKSYITPSEKIAVLDVEALIAESLTTASLENTTYGGSTEDYGITEADVKRRNLWDELW